MTPRHPVQRIYAGQNGVYDAVFSEDAGEWFIRYAPYLAYATPFMECEFSTTGYDSAHAARLAWERSLVTYQTLSQIRSVA